MDNNRDTNMEEWPPEVVAEYNTNRAAREAVKAGHRELFFDLRQCLFEHDPIGINFGSNTDEYDPEVGTIIPRLTECESQADVLEVVHQEFVRWFGTDVAGPRSRYEKVAEDVWDLWTKAGPTTGADSKDR